MHTKSGFSMIIVSKYVPISERKSVKRKVVRFWVGKLSIYVLFSIPIPVTLLKVSEFQNAGSLKISKKPTKNLTNFCPGI